VVMTMAMRFNPSGANATGILLGEHLTLAAKAANVNESNQSLHFCNSPLGRAPLAAGRSRRCYSLICRENTARASTLDRRNPRFCAPKGTNEQRALRCLCSLFLAVICCKSLKLRYRARPQSLEGPFIIYHSEMVILWN
jgi:hypothetical protein